MNHFRNGNPRGARRGGDIYRGPPRRQNLPSVPSRRDVLPGASVSIVLKADQSTGREVQGIVQDVLTSGDHPRGIKVRLGDGRVGRVQRMVSEGQADSGPGEVQVVQNAAAQQPSHSQQLRYRDVRLDEEPDAPPAEYDLSAFIRTAKPKKGKAKPAEKPVKVDEITEASCPVCGSFKGDEAAVAHHVESHFT